MKRASHFIPFLVFLFTFALYFQTRTFEHVRLDDGLYAIENPHIKAGLTREGVIWAFTNRETGNIQPLTFISLMTDVELFGLNMGALHLINGFYHALTALLFFYLLLALLRAKEGEDKIGPASWALLCSAAAGVLFWSLHPLRVESVAWVSSRKDVLSGIFCMLGLLAHLKEVNIRRGAPVGQRSPTAPQPVVLPVENFFSQHLSSDGLGTCSRWWWVSVCCFLLGYAAKPTMMIYPGFAALVEWYVAGRLRWKPLIPLGIIVVALGYMTVRAQEVAIDANIPALTRLINGVVAYGEYLMKTLYPAKLSIFYPYGVNLFHWKIAVGFLLLGSSLTLLFYTLKRAPVCALAIGWLICGLVPVIGFIHVGIASHADRYTYLSTMGLSVALAVFLRSMTRAGRGWLFALVTLPLAIYALVAALYIQAWQNNYTIFHHAIESCPENAKAWQQLGAEYANRFKNPDEGIACYRRALAILASDECGSQLASALAIRGKPGDFEEVKRLTLGVAQNPELDETGGALLGLGIVAMREQRWQDAVKYLTLSEKRKTSPSVCLWLGMSLYQTGRIQEAAKLFKEVSEDAPEACDREEGRKRLAYVLQKYGNLLK